MVNEWLIYVLIGALGFFVGIVSVFRGYSEKIKDVLLDLKIRDKIDLEEYDYFMRKYVTREDKTRRFINILKKVKKKEEKDVIEDEEI